MTKSTVAKLYEADDPVFRIESGVPWPSTRCVRRGRGRPRLYPFDKMKVGDSFDAGEHSPRCLNSVRAASFAFGRINNKEFLVLKTDDNRIRCWRVA